MKKFLISIILSVLVLFTNVYAESKDRNNLPNYGVNKHFTINSSNKNNVLNTPLVDASIKVHDYANILTNEEKAKLQAEANNFINKTKMDIVILTINEPYTYDKYNETIAADFYDYNDFGIDFKKYSGVLLLRNAYEKDPYFNIYTFGNAQLYFDYNRLENCLDEIYGDMRSKNYYSAFSTFIRRMSKYYDRGVASQYRNYYVDDNGDLHKKFVPPILIAIIISGIVTFIVIGFLVRRNKMVIKPTKADEYLDVNSINYTEKVDKFKNSVTTSYVTSSSSGGSSGGGGSHSHGSSGGGHSSGGGRHG